MQLNPIVLMLIAVLSLCPLQALAGESQTLELMTIDLFQAQFNGKRLTDITLDELTDWLGKPSGIRTNKDDSFGIDLYYHDRGLVFNVLHPHDDPHQRIRYVSVYFSKRWDAKFFKFFVPYTGMISKNINGQWKVPRVRADFAEFQMREYQHDETMKSLAAVREVLAMDEKREHILTTSRLDLKSESSYVMLVYEPTTKFIEWLNLVALTPGTPQTTEQPPEPSQTRPEPKRQKPKSTSPLKSR